MDRWVNTDQATKIIGKPKKKVEQWIREGILRTDHLGHINMQDVTDLRQAFDSHRGPRSQAEKMAELEIKLARLELLVAGICRTAGEPAASGYRHLGDQEIYRLYDACMSNLGRDHWTTHEITSWTSDFLQLTEVDFDRLAGLTGNTHPWKPFLDLCYQLVCWCQQSGVYDVKQSEAAFLLEKSMKSLRQAAVLHLEMSDHSPQRLVDRYLGMQPADRLAHNYLGIKKKY